MSKQSISRELVYRHIDKERDYQEFLSKLKQVKRDHSVGEFLILLHEYIEKAMNSWVTHDGNYHALVDIRKVAALAVQCLENHGCPERQYPPEMMAMMRLSAPPAPTIADVEAVLQKGNEEELPLRYQVGLTGVPKLHFTPPVEGIARTAPRQATSALHCDLPTDDEVAMGDGR